MTGSLASRKSKLPEANKMARMLRTGRTIDDLALRYGAKSSVIIQQLITNGWNPQTGAWTGGDKGGHLAGAPLSARGAGAGQACHYVGGGDNPNVVPTTTRPFRQRSPQIGIVWPAPEDRPVAVPPPAKPRPVSNPWGRSHANRKVTAEQATEMARRYLDGESSVILGHAFGVNERTVRKYLGALGVPLRSRSEALQLSYLQRRATVTLAAPILTETAAADVA